MLYYFHLYPVLLRLLLFDCGLWLAPNWGEEWLCVSKLAKIADSSSSSSQLTCFCKKVTWFNENDECLFYMLADICFCILRKPLNI